MLDGKKFGGSIMSKIMFLLVSLFDRIYHVFSVECRAIRLHVEYSIDSLGGSMCLAQLEFLALVAILSFLGQSLLGALFWPHHRHRVHIHNAALQIARWKPILNAPTRSDHVFHFLMTSFFLMRRFKGA